MGYDIHRLVPGRPLILGGVEIPFHLGLQGHSDADVLLHALCDALLGAAGERDIGYHFPPDDQRFEGISSMVLLSEVKKIIGDGLAVINIDAVIIAEKPKLAPFTETMEGNIGHCLDINPKDVNIKATTNEGIGGIGRGEAIAAHAVVSIKLLR